MGSQQRMAGSQHAVLPDWVTLRAMEPYFSWTADWVDMSGASFVYAKANILLPNISVKAYITFMRRSTPSFDLVRMFAALADPTRLRLLNLMNGREVCVSCDE